MPKRIIMTEDNKPTVGYFLGVDGKYYAPNSIHGRQMIGYCAFKGIDGMHRIVALNVSSALRFGNNGDPYTPISDADAPIDMAGKEHTEKFKQIGISNFPQAQYCANYSPGYKNGEWYYPSLGELYTYWDNIAVAKQAFKDAGITTNQQFELKSTDIVYMIGCSTLSSSGNNWYRQLFLYTGWGSSKLASDLRSGFYDGTSLNPTYKCYLKCVCLPFLLIDK